MYRLISGKYAVAYDKPMKTDKYSAPTYSGRVNAKSANNGSSLYKYIK